MTKKNCFIWLATALIALLAIIAPVFANAPIASADLLTSASRDTSDEISVTATKRVGGNITFDATAGKLGELDYYKADWAETEYFTISLSEAFAEEEDEYTYSVEVMYSPIRANEAPDFVADNTTTDIVLSDTVVNSKEAVTFNYYIDKQTEDAKKSLDKGWGTYRFTLTVNDTPYSSDLYYVAPSVPIKAPSIDKEEAGSSSSSMGSKWRCFITNEEDYRYVDESLIRWYVKGVGKDGTKYAYHENDLGTTDFPTDEYTHALYSATGDRIAGAKEFVFDTSVAGDWTIYCVVFDKTPAANANQDLGIFKSAQNLSIETGNNINPSYVIWIIVAAAVVVVGVLVFIIIKSVKKEKVW